MNQNLYIQWKCAILQRESLNKIISEYLKADKVGLVQMNTEFDWDL